MGSLIFQILTGEIVWHNYIDNQKTLDDEREIQQLIAKTNATPPLPTKYQNSNNPIHIVLKTVMYDMCFIADPIQRSSSREVADYLRKKTIELGHTYLLDELE